MTVKNRFLNGWRPTLPVQNAQKLAYLGFDGRNGAGACTLTGAVVGDIVVGVVNLVGGGESSNFEAVITVADQIQQTSGSNLSANKYSVLLIQDV